jgi:hypothetical protein
MNSNEATRSAVIFELLANARATVHSTRPAASVDADVIAARSKATKATALPEDIYRCIQAYTSINALLNTSRRLADVKRRLYIWNLNRNSAD